MDIGSLIDFEEKSSVSETEDCFRFEGYAAIFGTKDQGKDIIERGAFADSLKSIGLPLLLYNHKMAELPVGVIDDAAEDRKGLLVAGELPKDDPVSRRVGIALKARKNGQRALKGMSIGYNTIEHTKNRDGGRNLIKLNLHEVSFVNFPMHRDAGVNFIKSETLSVDEFKNLSDREREVRLKTLGLSDTLAKQFVRLARDERDGSDHREGDLTGSMPDFASLISNAAKRIAQ